MNGKNQLAAWKFVVLLLMTTFVMGIAFPVGKLGLAMHRHFS